MELENKRALWTEGEVNELLGLLKEDNILSKLDGKTKGNNSIYLCLLIKKKKQTH